MLLTSPSWFPTTCKISLNNNSIEHLAPHFTCRQLMGEHVFRLELSAVFLSAMVGRRWRGGKYFLARSAANEKINTRSAHFAAEHAKARRGAQRAPAETTSRSCISRSFPAMPRGRASMKNHSLFRQERESTGYVMPQEGVQCFLRGGDAGGVFEDLA